jgi:tRNA(Ile)-lysidine synthase
MKRKSLNVQKIIPNYLNDLLIQNSLKHIFNKFEKKLDINQSYLVAVSGGSDSLALAFLSKCFEKKYDVRFNYCIVDHKLRSESSKEANEVCRILKKIKINCKILKWKGFKPSSNVQAIARINRYSLLEKECTRTKSQNILLGHQRDDANENFFIRMTRGSGLKGLVSLDENLENNKINYIRPLLDYNKNDLEKMTLKVFKIFIKDPSNLDENYKRIRVRKILKALKNEGLNNNKLMLTIKNLKDSNNALDYYAKKNIEDNLTFKINKKKATLNKFFFSQPNEVILRSLNLVIQKIGQKYYPPRGKSTIFLINQLKKSKKLKKITLGGCLFKKINETIIISKESG